MTSLLCLPVVVCNLGVEMLYVLEQRLRAQSVSDVKSVKVLHDVTRAMFAPEFVNELFTPQVVYTPSATRAIFDKLAHTSIMRLSEQSMDKLFDLMTMGFKYQLVQCVRPEDILNVTLLHLQTLKSYLTDESVTDALSAVDAELRATYGAFSKHEWLALRRELFRFLGNKRVKVSLLLHEKLQLDDGRVRLPVVDDDVNVEQQHTTNSAAQIGPVGTLRRHDIAGLEHTRTRKVAEFVSFDHPSGKKHKGAPRPEIPPGGNMYSRDRQAPHAPEPIQTLCGAKDAVRDAHGNVMARTSLGSIKSGGGNADRMMASAGRESFVEANALAGLIRGSPSSAKTASDKHEESAKDVFKLNLFGDVVAAGGDEDDNNGAGVNDMMTILEFRGDEGLGNKASGLADVMRSFGVDEKAPPGKSNGKKDEFALDDDDDDSEDDLLALMDGA
jgi:hypothetical protein